MRYSVVLSLLVVIIYVNVQPVFSAQLRMRAHPNRESEISRWSYMPDAEQGASDEEEPWSFGYGYRPFYQPWGWGYG
ncbi:hypothetical protein ANCCAN_04582 [Ancylostoma caninum]|uniref:Sulfur globule protein CV3 domain protein n=1 Tax=Ancylostoma caninum TaxID=29170 RepID=A0A368GY86_ANCCA|nr:hypothetical protein ANCCAN_04582 [Ancylostoma caninum]